MLLLHHQGTTDAILLLYDCTGMAANYYKYCIATTKLLLVGPHVWNTLMEEWKR